MFIKLILGKQNFQFAVCACALVLLAGCGGDDGNESDSGPQQTTLSVAASDADGDALNYQWRVTSGVIDNPNASKTVWTLPPGPGLHFAYVIVSDGKGGYAEQQYAVSSDAIGIVAPTPSAITRPEPMLSGVDGVTGRLRFRYEGRNFVPAAGGEPVERFIYAPSIPVEVRVAGASVTSPPRFSGVSDESGEVQLPALPVGRYDQRCATSRGSVLVDCGPFTIANTGAPTVNVPITDKIPVGNNLRLYGHLVLSDGSVCGTHNEFAGIRSIGTVQVIDAAGVEKSAQVEINRFGDYAIDAPVLVNAPHRLRVRCDSLTTVLSIRTPEAGFVDTAIELSATLPNSRPSINKVVAYGLDGNVRGRMVVAEPNAASNSLSGPDQFLAYKGKDTRLGACLYYKSFGAVEDCDAQGRMINSLTLDDWKRKNKLQPYAAGNIEYKATYINKMDLNLVRRMSATQSSPDNIAFYVCNNPGPVGSTQREVNNVIGTALDGKREVACVAMEWSATQGINDNKPLTKFLSFGPDGSLLLSVNLDGRGEKFLPGTCVACHGGTHYSGKFPDKHGTSASPFIGSAFLTFDTGNYLFSTDNGLGKSEQQAAIKELNKLVIATERDYVGTSPVKTLYDGWYAGGRSTLDEDYVPAAWANIELTRPGAARLYREVVGTSCRTCHGAFKSFDWDANPNAIIGTSRNDHVCGGSRDLMANASMPNALVARDIVMDRVNSDPSLAALMQNFFGCTTRLPDPAYDRR
jgi:hypothetical protein